MASSSSQVCCSRNVRLGLPRSQVNPTRQTSQPSNRGSVRTRSSARKPEVGFTSFHGRCGSISAALAYIDVLAPHHPLFVEEPIQPGDHQAMAQITARAGCPIATGERLFLEGH